MGSEDRDFSKKSKIKQTKECDKIIQLSNANLADEENISERGFVYTDPSTVISPLKYGCWHSFLSIFS